MLRALGAPVDWLATPGCEILANTQMISQWCFEAIDEAHNEGFIGEEAKASTFLGGPTGRRGEAGAIRDHKRLNWKG